MQSRTQVQIDLNKVIDKFNTKQVLKVGWLKRNRYPEELGGIYVAEAAAMNEYGVPHRRVEPRPFMRPAIVENKNQWLGLIEKGSKRIANGTLSLDDMFVALGERVASDIRQAIINVTSPALSEITILNRLSRLSNKARKGAIDKPLVDTGLMLESVTHNVEYE